jgi:hypothetical protein
VLGFRGESGEGRGDDEDEGARERKKGWEERVHFAVFHRDHL